MWSAKDIVKRIKGQATDRENTHKKSYLMKRLIQNIQGNQKLSKKANNPIKKWAKRAKQHCQRRYRCQRSMGKDVPHHMSSGKLKQWDGTAHLLEWSNPRTLTTSNPGEDIEQH